ncbi:casein kinase II, regulatory subunit [Protomyces lactucae-debilis]|uniref:Casein kinase II subunit beta n=1 Tax=Protomyces lactucae-debilis TaxID=2754530 RepID=A0A1Y2F9D6_PROLT|nr:casein kinase II, regulatory subunit [Protomyces lactucae-debilis]ORY80530.1 casein kinase II, regulatory subunit [Protomyces lactucae-debilis]
MDATKLSNDSAESLDNAETWDSDGQTSSTGSENLSWIAWYCSLPGHDYFCEVAEDYIEDDFNMTGLSSLVPMYKEALEFVLDLEPDDDEFELDAAERRIVEASAELLYGLVHQRFITSRAGLALMAEKYEAGHFGVCPRLLCHEAAVLPVGLSDVVEEDPVKLFCPNCLDAYNPPNSRYNAIDGAYFGTTFPHLFFMTFPELLPFATGSIYDPCIFGFKVSERSKTGPRMRWLRAHIGSAEANEASSEGSSNSGDGEPPAGSEQDGKAVQDTSRPQEHIRDNSTSHRAGGNEIASNHSTVPMDCASTAHIGAIKAALYHHQYHRSTAPALAVEA